jgi:hypothetical protein
MRRRTRFLAVAIAAVTLFGCDIAPRDNMFDPGSSNYYRGKMLIVFDDGMARTIDPPISMNIASYRIEGAGPNGAAFSRNTSQQTEEIIGLDFGQWTISVNGYNAASELIGHGSATATITSNQTLSVPVTLTPITGDGGFSLSLSWDPDEIVSPVIIATLTPLGGGAETITFTVNTLAGTASYSDAAISAGYYTLSLSLTDSGTNCGGATEVVRIASGHTTVGALALSIGNHGSIEVVVTTRMNDPIIVTLIGTAATITRTGTMALTPSVQGVAVPVSYMWYLDGVYMNNTATYTVNGSGLLVGAHRLDVVAYTGDYTRAGSTKHEFTVIP